MIKKHKIIYVDEDSRAIRKFKRNMKDTFEVIGKLPEEGFDQFLEELLSSDAKAIVVDHRLNEYRDDVDGHISYTGTQLLTKFWEIRKGFPGIVLTSYDNDAIMDIDDVNYVYPKAILQDPVGKVSLPEKIRYQIEHYESRVNKRSARFDELLVKSRTKQLTEEEETELLNLDSYLESTLNNHQALPIEKKNELALGRIDELIASTNALLNELKGHSD